MEELRAATKLKLTLGGDVMLGRRVNEVIHCCGPTYPFEPLKPILEQTDLFFVNLECAISPRLDRYSGPPKAFYFRADPLAANTLTHAGVNLVSLANNHALDADVAGLRDTIAILNARKILHPGAGETFEQASAPAYLQKKNHRIAVLAYCDHQRDFAAEGDRPGIRYVDLSAPEIAAWLADQVHAIAPMVDHLIVSMHWQPNWAPQVLPFYRHLARRMIDAGARVVWGHSPHHFQGVEWIGRPARGIVLYSTGDLLTDYAIDPDFRNDRQLLFQLTLSQGGVDSVRAYPLELELGRTAIATPDGAEWIYDRFAASCDELDTHVEEADEFLAVHAGPKPDPVAEREFKIANQT